MSRKERYAYSRPTQRQPSKQERRRRDDEVEKWRKRINIDPSQYVEGSFHVHTMDEGLSGYKSIYFINASDETLSQVQYSTGGFATPDPDLVVPVSAPIRSYDNVAPGEAVRFDFYDCWFDYDFILEYYFAVMRADGTREELGPIHCSKGLDPNAVLGTQGRQFQSDTFFSRCPDHILPKPYRKPSSSEK